MADIEDMEDIDSLIGAIMDYDEPGAESEIGSESDTDDERERLSKRRRTEPSSISTSQARQGVPSTQFDRTQAVDRRRSVEMPKPRARLSRAAKISFPDCRAPSVESVRADIIASIVQRMRDAGQDPSYVLSTALDKIFRDDVALVNLDVLLALRDGRHLTLTDAQLAEVLKMEIDTGDEPVGMKYYLRSWAIPRRQFDDRLSIMAESEFVPEVCRRGRSRLG